MHCKILSYAEEKLDLLSKEYSNDKVDEVTKKMNPLWNNLLIKLNEHIADEDLVGAKKTLDEYFKLARREIIKTFN
jgi:hypothetical protein